MHSTKNGHFVISLGIPSISIKGTITKKLGVFYAFSKTRLNNKYSTFKSRKEFVSIVKDLHKTALSDLGLTEYPPSWKKLIPTKKQYSQILEMIVGACKDFNSQHQARIKGEEVISGTHTKPEWLLPYPGLTLIAKPSTTYDAFIIELKAYLKKNPHSNGRAIITTNYDDLVTRWEEVIKEYKRLNPKVKSHSIPPPSPSQYDEIWNAAIEKWRGVYPKSYILKARE